MSGLLSYKTLVHACAGCAGSSCAACVTMPLTTAFTRIQLDEKMKSEGPLQVMLRLARDEGFLTLFRGGQSTIVRLIRDNEARDIYLILLPPQCSRVQLCLFLLFPRP